MGKGIDIGVNDISRKVKAGWIGVSDVSRKIKAGWIGVNGVAKLFYEGEDPLDYFCIAADDTNVEISATKNGYSYTAPTLEYSLDKSTWYPFVIDSTIITLSDWGDKVYFRGNNSSFSQSLSQYITFNISKRAIASGNIMSLLDKTCQSLSVDAFGFHRLFAGAKLVAPPKLPATELDIFCYQEMFIDCTLLNTLPLLPATTLKSNCYEGMFNGCTNIKLSAEQSGAYYREYRIPTSGTGTTATDALKDMFANTGGTFVGTPNINTTYYTDRRPV